MKKSENRCFSPLSVEAETYDPAVEFVSGFPSWARSNSREIDPGCSRCIEYPSCKGKVREDRVGRVGRVGRLNKNN